MFGTQCVSVDPGADDDAGVITVTGSSDTKRVDSTNGGSTAVADDGETTISPFRMRELRLWCVTGANDL